MFDIEAIKARQSDVQIGDKTYPKVNALGGNDQKDIRDLIAEVERLNKMHGDGADEETIARMLQQEKDIQSLRAEGKRQKRAFDDLLASAESAVKLLCSDNEDSRNDAVPYLRNRIYQARKDWDSGRECSECGGPRQHSGNPPGCGE